MLRETLGSVGWGTGEGSTVEVRVGDGEAGRTDGYIQWGRDGLTTADAAGSSCYLQISLTIPYA